ncbi:hypothetical protein HGRIS_014132 [Hohenbuehelia grisea]|uniref:Uncharacterized protein n=1 Tax=Hohenbuehelia grisea TaxID=104357 RepID=A0ABR3JUJ1_9AGAR
MSTNSDIEYSHPSAVGAGVQPQTSRAPVDSRIQTDRPDTRSPPPSTAPDGQDYPEQKHAGAVGIGPNFSTKPTMGDKLAGMKEEVKGKVSHNPGLVEQGHKRRTGELKREQRRDDTDPFATPDDGDHELHHEKSHMEQAATVAPEGTDDANMQRRGGAVDRVKHI